MSDFVPENLEPIQDVIERVRSLKSPTYKNKDCQQLEIRFWHQDWNTQLDIYEIWLNIDNSYSRSCLYRVLNRGYWKLLNELSNRGIERAKELSNRIMEYSIKRMRTQNAAYFVTEYAPIDIVRKHKKLLAWSLDIAYNSLAQRIGGDADFKIDKERLCHRLEYYDICAKFNLPTSDEEAIDDLKLYFKYYGNEMWCNSIDTHHVFQNFKFSLRLNIEINNWRNAIEKLGLSRAAKAFDSWDADLQSRINGIYEADSQYRNFPEIYHDRIAYYWSIFTEMATKDLFPDTPKSKYLDDWLSLNPKFAEVIKQLDLQIIEPLQLD